VSNGTVPFSAALTGLPAGTTIHYRAVAASDFGTFAGADQTLTTTAAAPGSTTGTAKVSKLPSRVSGTTARVRVSCTGAPGATCRVTLKLTVTETLSHGKVTAVSARKKHKVVVVGSASVTLKAGETKTIRVSLNRSGKHLLAHFHRLKVKLRVSQATATKGTTAVSTQTTTFKPVTHKHHR